MCTTIFWRQTNATLLANNEDIFLETGFLFSNQRGIAKEALIFPPDIPLRWVSRFGSLVFSQCGKEFPSGGMNEVGLVVEQMTLPETAYPAADERQAVKELQVIQYLLDTCGTVADALVDLKNVRIAQASGVLHYFLADSTGDAAVVEFLNGQMQVYQGPSLPVPALTNSTYAYSLQSRQSPDWETSAVSDYQRDSLRRFQIAARWAGVPLTADAHRQAFEALAQSARPDTAWRIVYDLLNLAIHVQTGWNPAVRSVSFSVFDFSPEKDGQLYDLRGPEEGNIENCFTAYTMQRNQELVYSFFRNETIVKSFGMALPDEVLNGFAAYPVSLLPAG